MELILLVTDKEKNRVKKAKVLQRIDDKINEIFSECQEEVGIKSGDIEPLRALELEELKGKLADVIYEVLARQIE